MIGYLSGKLIAIEDSALLIDIGGVGYQVMVPSRLAESLSMHQEVVLHVHTVLRENALELFGFESALEKRLFLLLTSVSGVGPRTAVGILSGLTAEMVISAINRGDKAALSLAPGIGKKSAERLVVELADKVQKLGFEKSNTVLAKRSLSPASKQIATSKDIFSDSVQALVQLGYSESQASSVVRDVSNHSAEKSFLSVEQVVKSSLKQLSQIKLGVQN